MGACQVPTAHFSNNAHIPKLELGNYDQHKIYRALVMASGKVLSKAQIVLINAGVRAVLNFGPLMF